MRYVTNNDKHIIFDEESDCCCLCTFPHNNEVAGKKLTEEIISSLALLGAAVAIAANKPSSMDEKHLFDNRYYLPECVPKWIRDEINRILDVKTE